VAGHKEQASERGSEASGSGSGGGLWEQVWTLGLAILIALGVRHFVIEPFRIPSGSMFPTLLIGDHLFVNKFIYGVKVPFTDIRLPGIRDPEHGDVIVFTVAKRGSQTFPADRKPDLPREEFVKRLIGLPGDEIDMRNGELFVNGEPVDISETGEIFEDPSGRHLEIEHVSFDTRNYAILDDPRQSGPSAAWPVRVEEGRYFFLGDNRDHSKDSRVWGTVRHEELKGPAFILYWSWNFGGSWTEVFNPMTWWRVEKRWDRIGDLVR
jgi:signal peptidase I